MVVLSSTYSDSHRPTVAEYRRQGYLANGWNKVRRWNGRTAALETAGITGPSRVTDSWTPSPTAAAGVSTVGLHAFRYRYMDSRTGYVSNPSEAREVEVASGGESLTFAIDTAGAGNIIRSTDTKVDRIVLEVSPVGSIEFYKAAEALNTASTIVFNMADATLEQLFLPWTDDGHDPPPLSKNILSHRDRLWLYGQVVHRVGTADFTNGSANVEEGSTDPDWLEETFGAASGQATTSWFIQRDDEDVAYEIDYYDLGNTRLVLKAVYPGTTAANQGYRIFSRTNVVWVSEPGFPESFTPLKFLNGPNGEGAGDLTAAVGFGSSVLFFAAQSVFKFTWDQGPHEDGFYTPLSGQIGALNQRVVIEVEGTVYAMDRRGWSVWTGVFPKLMSRAIDPVRSLIDYSQAENFHCVWLPETRAVRWFVCYTGETYPKHYVQLDVDTGAWSTGEYLHEVSESRLVPTSGGLRRVLLGDSTGYTWWADEGVADGLPGDLSHLTDDGTSTALVVGVDETLPTSGSGLAGMFLTRRTTAGVRESRQIASNTDSQITLSSAFSAAPVDGDVLWVGVIPTKLKTKAFRSKGNKNVKRSAFVWLIFEPTEETRYLQLRVYENLSDTAKTGWTSRNNPPGCVRPGSNVRYPTTDWLVDLSTSEGFVSVPIGREFRRHFELELEIYEPDADFKLVLFEHDGDSVEEVGS